MPKQKAPSAKIRTRLLVCFAIFSLLICALILRLAWIQLVKAEEYRKMAHDQWNRTVREESQRGAILDRNMRVLAGSATAETIMAFPPLIADPEGTARALAETLDADYQRMYDLVSSNLGSVYIRRKVDEETAAKVRELSLPGIRLTTESKRFYPNERLLSQVLGFVGMDQGWSGLEVRYEETLKGRDGYLTYLATALGLRVPQGKASYIPPQEGRDLVLTVDEFLQFILERELDRAMLEYKPQGVTALAVHPMTGEILAMASKPDFDPNNYSQYPQETWQIPSISSTFEPGSTFKMVTLAAAIEQALYDPGEAFFCSGSLRVGGHTIGCWTRHRGGHGAIDFLRVVLGSCNPGFMVLGADIGGETLMEYIKAFGFGARTGIDLPGESTGILFREEQFGPVELATTSFGQGISVTPLQQMMAVSAMINGGNLMQPYIVSEIREPDGTIVDKREPTLVRRVISSQTSEQIKEIMELVVQEGGGRNAAILGHRIGGKTGTAQKVGPDGRYIPGEYILSFMGFFPVEKPEVLLYITVDGATRGVQYGSHIPAPLFKRVARDFMNYLSIKPGNLEELEAPPSLVEVPDLRGLNLEKVAETLDLLGLLATALGEGGVVEEQTPGAGVLVPLYTEILIYTEREVSGLVQVPNLTGRTMREAAEILDWLGLSMRSQGSGIVLTQDPVPWEKVPAGSEVVLEFGRDH